MLPLLQREVVDRMKIVDEDELLSIFAISQCTPGPIAVNTATSLGRKVGGFKGSIASTLGVISPSIIIITLVAMLFSNLPQNAYVNHAMAGIRATVAALILISAWRLAKKAVSTWKQLLLLIVSFAVVALLHVSPVWVIAGAAVIGLLFFRSTEEGGDGK